MNRAYRLSSYALTAALALACAAAVPVVWSLADAGPAEHRESWCPSPEQRRGWTVEVAATSRVQVVDRLREVRIKFGRLHEGELMEAPDEDAAPGTVAEVDHLLRDLISDLDRAARSEETNP